MCPKIAKHLGGLLLFLFVFIGATWFTGLGNDVPFDSNNWLRSNARDRGRMAEDLVASRVLIGQAHDEVLRQLGQPQKDWGKVIQYHIDLGWPLKKPEHYGLQVHFDADRVVREVKIVD
jgi:hypothetical protein